MPRTHLLLVAALASGLVAGVFFAFSNFVMAGIGRLSAQNGIAAMQSINITVINPLFMGLLFGTAALSLYLGFTAWQHWPEAGSGVLLIAAISYVVGVGGVTMAFNVPLNNALAAVEPASANAKALWESYLSRWVMWNHVRGLAAVATSGLCIWLLQSG